MCEKKNEGTGPVIVAAQDQAVVGSEFAQVEVGLDNRGNGPRLRLEDLRTGRVRYLDALELETIIWLREGHLRRLLDPAADRWREDAGR
jgi:hypothetical protein